MDLDGNNFNAYDYYYGEGPFEVAAFPPAGHAGYGANAPLPLDPTGATHPARAYLWLQFDASLPKNTRINALVVEVWEADTGMIADGFAPVTYYLQNDVGSSGTKRWNGPAFAPDYPEFTGNNPQVLVAVTTYGIPKTNPAFPEQLYNGQAGGFIALLGAICLDEMDPDGTYFVAITEIDYMEGAPDPDDWGYDTYFTTLPQEEWLLGDLDCSGAVDFADINPFVTAIANPVTYEATFPYCNRFNADINEDGAVDIHDINPFVMLLLGS